jgi:hypothetical protein
MHPDVPYFSILLCLTCQVECAATQWVNELYALYDSTRYTYNTSMDWMPPTPGKMLPLAPLKHGTHDAPANVP